MTSNKECQRCHSPFLCQPSNIEQCQCASIDLDQQTHEYLKKTFYGCLCQSCLSALNDLVISLKDKPFSPRAPLVENEDYYIEQGMFVFTERYHIWKGYCCKKGCRHCAYGFQLETLS